MIKKVDIWDSYNNLILSDDIERLKKILVRHDLYKLTQKLPGDIVECGVFKGVGYVYWLKLLKIYEQFSHKKVIGFDTFGAFSDSLLDYEKVSAKKFMNEASFKSTDLVRLNKVIKEIEMKERAELIKGDVIKTCKKYVKNNPGFRISLLHLDLDTYHGTKQTLENFWDLIVPGGVIVLDEYAKRGWGESDAVDEFIKDKNIIIQQIEFSSQPTAMIIR